jgi:hypothetical protein
LYTENVKVIVGIFCGRGRLVADCASKE